MTRVLLICAGALSLASSASFGGSDQETMGQGIVRGTLGAQPGEVLRLAFLPRSAGLEVSGQVLALEGGAYVIQQPEGKELRLSLDENTRIDRPAHVGDRIRVLLDNGGRALVIRTIDTDE